MERTVISNAKYLDVKSGQYKENQYIVMRDRKFVWIGGEGSFEKEKDDVIYDASGKFVVPGLIDCHVHLDANSTSNIYQQFMTTPFDLENYFALEHAQKHVASGFTTVRDVGSGKHSYPAIKHVLNDLRFAGSRIFGSSGMILQYGNQENEYPEALMSHQEYWEDESGPMGMRDAVRRRIKHGADWIKIELTGGVLHGEHSRLEKSFFQDDELEEIVNEAHRSGIYVCAHCHGDEGIYRGTKIGIDTIEHGSFVSENTAKLMVERQNYIIPTKIAIESLKEPEIFSQMTSAIQHRVNEASEKVHKCHKIAFDMGVNFALGTDAGTPGNFHGTSAREMQYSVDLLQISNLRAIQMATIDGARALKQENHLGSIEVGKFADLVIMENDPTKDVKVLQNYENQTHVFRDGVLMAQKGKIVYTLNMRNISK